MTENPFDVRQWNMSIDLLCSAEQFQNINRQEYAVDLLTAYSVARDVEKKNPDVFKANSMTRQRIHGWIKNFAQYQDFVDGCWLLMRYYDTGNLLTKDEATLTELHRRWSSLVNLSMAYGNAYQIANFVPFANKIVAEIVETMLRKKKKSANKFKHNRPENWRLSRDEVKAEINCEWIFQHYFPDMKETTKGHYRAYCKWHIDAPGGKPNLDIDTIKGMCHCKRCNAGFDVFGVIMDLDGVDFATSLKTAWDLGR